MEEILSNLAHTSELVKDKCVGPSALLKVVSNTTDLRRKEIRFP